MIKEYKESTNPSEFSYRDLFTAHGITFITIWLISTVVLVVMLFLGVRDTGQFQELRYILQSAYVLALIWYLIRTGPSVNELPELNPVLLPKRWIGKLIPPIFIAFLFLGELIEMDILRILMMLAAILILIFWRREISLSTSLLGLAVVTISLLGGIPFYEKQVISHEFLIVLMAFVLPMFIAGDLLRKKTGLVGSQLYEGRYKKAVVSFLWGCLLFIPMGLFNASAGSPGSRLAWVSHWWEPFSLPWFSGIVEEAWFRLFLVTLCYYLLRPAFPKRPTIPLFCAALFSAITFGLGHGGTYLARVLDIGLLYGGSLAVIFLRRDYEHAVGAHYMINMIPTMIVFLEV